MSDGKEPATEPKKLTAKEERMRARLAEQEALEKAKAEALLSFQHIFGFLPLTQSTSNRTLRPTAFAQITPALVSQTITVRARLHNVRKQGGKMCFLILREFGATLQGVLSTSNGLPAEMIAFAAGLPIESIVDVRAVLTQPEKPVESTSLKDFELQVQTLHVVSKSLPVLPFQLADASRRTAEAPLEEEDDKKKEAEKKEAVVNQDTRLNCRWLELRTPASNAIFRVQSRVGQFFREFLTSQDFVEIHTPKIIGTASEGGANVFKLGYFGKDGFLAQSPQLYKQMAVQGDLPRVFEVGSVFRAENSFTHRHLTEFIGLDIEMVINEHYYEVLDVAEDLFAYIFARLAKLPELAIIDQQHPFEPFVYQVPEERIDSLGIGIISEGREPTDEYHARIQNRHSRVIRMPLTMGVRLLNRHSEKQIPEDEDIDTESEKKIGPLMKARYGVDFYIFDRYPWSARPFYTMPCADNPNFTNSYDMFMRGEEISSGAQRIHDAEMLRANAQKKNVDVNLIKDYVDSFRLGAWPHGGFGVGLERVTMLYLGLKNIRYTSLFPRDPRRITP